MLVECYSKTRDSKVLQDPDVTRSHPGAGRAPEHDR